MAAKAKPKRTPAQIMRDMISGAIGMRGETQKTLAKKIHASEKTVYSDLHYPERIPQHRLWLYFTVLEIPINTVLQAVGDAYIKELIKR